MTKHPVNILGEDIYGMFCHDTFYLVFILDRICNIP